MGKSKQLYIDAPQNMTKLRERLNVEHVSVHGLCKILIVILERYRERSGELDM